MKKNTILSLALSALLVSGSLVSSTAMAQSENASPVADEVAQGESAKSGEHKKAKKAKHKAKKAKHKAKHKAKQSH
jgi:hypothetical protein